MNAAPFFVAGLLKEARASSVCQPSSSYLTGLIPYSPLSLVIIVCWSSKFSDFLFPQAGPPH
jgi:hypothetical protein